MNFFNHLCQVLKADACRYWAWMPIMTGPAAGLPCVSSYKKLQFVAQQWDVAISPEEIRAIRDLLDGHNSRALLIQYGLENLAMESTEEFYYGQLRQAVHDEPVNGQRKPPYQLLLQALVDYVNVEVSEKAKSLDDLPDRHALFHVLRNHALGHAYYYGVPTMLFHDEDMAEFLRELRAGKVSSGPALMP